MNDDLGNFPTPSAPTSTPPKEPYTPPAFEPTPDEIPSQRTYTDKPEGRADFAEAAEPTPPIDNFFPEIEPKKTTPSSPPPSTIYNLQYTQPTPSPEPVLATTPPSSKSGTSSLLSIVLLLVAGVGISGSVFLYSQSSSLKKQLTDITKTLEQQKSVITPSPTPTIIDIPSPTPTEKLIAPTPTATPSTTIDVSKGLIPLALAPQALKVGINHEPNAQLILIKVENANNPETSLIKYFFRNSLTTKKYFYVSINGKNESEINDNAIYVNPDNNIPSLNDLILGNKLGLDYKEAYDISTKLCSVSCTNLPVNAQFIKSGTNTIWQITLDPAGKKYIVQINSTTKEVLFKSPSI